MAERAQMEGNEKIYFCERITREDYLVEKEEYTHQQLRKLIKSKDFLEHQYSSSRPQLQFYIHASTLLASIALLLSGLVGPHVFFVELSLEYLSVFSLVFSLYSVRLQNRLLRNLRTAMLATLLLASGLFFFHLQNLLSSRSIASPQGLLSWRVGPFLTDLSEHIFSRFHLPKEFFAQVSSFVQGSVPLLFYYLTESVFFHFFLLVGSLAISLTGFELWR